MEDHRPGGGADRRRVESDDDLVGAAGRQDRRNGRSQEEALTLDGGLDRQGLSAEVDGVEVASEVPPTGVLPTEAEAGNRQPGVLDERAVAGDRDPGAAFAIGVVALDVEGVVRPTQTGGVEDGL